MLPAFLRPGWERLLIAFMWDDHPNPRPGAVLREGDDGEETWLEHLGNQGFHPVAARPSCASTCCWHDESSSSDLEAIIFFVKPCFLTNKDFVLSTASAQGCCHHHYSVVPVLVI